jgi:2-keto-4-pentenoate hydratase/2-oxohepta-3-ene-1,7-dioic acid hydratase in catechol pathway
MEFMMTRWGIGRAHGENVDILDVPFADLRAVLAEYGSFAWLSTARVARTISRDQAVAHGLGAPLGRSAAVWGVGLNYHSKVIVTGRAIPTEPILFSAAAGAISAPGADIEYPEGCTTEFDYEGEVAAVIARRMYRVDARDAWKYVAGYTAASDMTARDVMRQTATPVLAKSFAGCKPVGGSLRVVNEPGDLEAIGVRTYVNGELRQEDSTSGMVWSIPELLSRLSWFAPLMPGDVFLSGTPSGTGQDRKQFLRIGDTVEVHVDGVEPLRNRIVAQSAPTGAPEPRQAQLT